MRCRYGFVIACASACLLPGLASAENAELEKKLLYEEQGPLNTSAGGTLDCTGATPLACDGTLAGTNATGPSNVSVYDCAFFSLTGPEVVHTITLAGPTALTVTMSGLADDLDLILLGSCDPADCLDASQFGGTTDESVGGILAAGTYYLVVDGFSGATSSYVLTAACGTPCSECVGNDICADAFPVPAEGGSFLHSATDACSSNDYTLDGGNACTGFSAGGNDNVYVVELTENCELCVSMDNCPTGGEGDRSVYLVMDCGAGAPPINLTGNCLAGADDTVATGAEAFCYTVPLGGAGTYYIIADYFTGGDEYQIDISIDCVIPTQEASWGQIKSTFGAR